MQQIYLKKLADLDFSYGLYEFAFRSYNYHITDIRTISTRGSNIFESSIYIQYIYVFSYIFTYLYIFLYYIYLVHI